MKLYEKITYLRKENQYTQEQLAEKLNITRQAISRWEAGITFPDTEKLILISQIFDVSLEYLIDDNAISKIDLKKKGRHLTFHNRTFLLMVLTWFCLTIGIGIAYATYSAIVGGISIIVGNFFVVGLYSINRSNFLLLSDIAETEYSHINEDTIAISRHLIIANLVYLPLIYTHFFLNLNHSILSFKYFVVLGIIFGLCGILVARIVRFIHHRIFKYEKIDYFNVVKYGLTVFIVVLGVLTFESSYIVLYFILFGWFAGYPLYLFLNKKIGLMPFLVSLICGISLAMQYYYSSTVLISFACLVWLSISVLKKKVVAAITWYIELILIVSCTTILSISRERSIWVFYIFTILFLLFIVCINLVTVSVKKKQQVKNE